MIYRPLLCGQSTNAIVEIQGLSSRTLRQGLELRHAVTQELQQILLSERDIYVVAQRKFLDFVLIHCKQHLSYCYLNLRKLLNNIF